MLTAILISSLLATGSSNFNPFSGPKPIVVFIQTNPWAMVIGSDTPRVVIYDTGEAIFAKKVRESSVYHRVVLDKDELARVREHLTPVLALKHLEPSYDIAPTITDQPEAMFYLRDGERHVATTVYGLVAHGTKLPAYTKFPDGPEPRVPPQELLKLHEWLCALDFPNGEKWTPPYVEVMLWDYSYAPDPSIPWPKEWPALDSARTVKRGDAYSIFLDGTLAPKLREFLAARKPKGAVELGGRKWAVSYRYAFPSEPEWRSAFAAAAEKGRDGG